MRLFSVFLVFNTIIFLVTGCNYTITMIHTEGQASDVVDETSSNTPNTSLTIPAKVI